MAGYLYSTDARVSEVIKALGPDVDVRPSKQLQDDIRVSLTVVLPIGALTPARDHKGQGRQDPHEEESSHCYAGNELAQVNQMTTKLGGYNVV